MWWAHVVVALAGAKVAIGMTLYLAGFAVPRAPTLVPPAVYVIIAAALTALGGLLVVGSRRDQRASWLGGTFVLCAASLTPLVNSSASDGPAVRGRRSAVTERSRAAFAS